MYHAGIYPVQTQSKPPPNRFIYPIPIVVRIWQFTVAPSPRLALNARSLHYLRAVESQRSNAQASTCSLAFSYYVPASELLLLLCLRHSPCPLPVKATLYLCDSSTRIPVLTPTSFFHTFRWVDDELGCDMAAMFDSKFWQFNSGTGARRTRGR